MLITAATAIIVIDEASSFMQSVFAENSMTPSTKHGMTKTSYIRLSSACQMLPP
jgi:hypothetical protein